MNQQNIVNACSGIVSSLEQEGDSETCYNLMTLEDITLSDINQSQKDQYCMIPLMRDTLEESKSNRKKMNLAACGGRGGAARTLWAVR